MLCGSSATYRSKGVLACATNCCAREHVYLHIHLTCGAAVGAGQNSTRTCGRKIKVGRPAAHVSRERGYRKSNNRPAHIPRENVPTGPQVKRADVAGGAPCSDACPNDWQVLVLRADFSLLPRLLSILTAMLHVSLLLPLVLLHACSIHYQGAVCVCMNSRARVRRGTAVSNVYARSHDTREALGMYVVCV